MNFFFEVTVEDTAIVKSMKEDPKYDKNKYGRKELEGEMGMPRRDKKSPIYRPVRFQRRSSI